MINNIDQFLVYPDDDIRSALDRINQQAEGIVILVDKNRKFIQTVTDGDLRRLILKAQSLETRLSELPYSESVVCPEGTNSAKALELMKSSVIDQLPVINADNEPTGLYIRREIEGHILLSTPHMGDLETGYVEEAFKTNWIAPLGPNVDAFEQEISEYVGVGFAAATNSGTSAIHLALLLLGVKPGDRVFCASFTFVASANPILYQGAIPVFIDSEPTSWNMSPQALERALEKSAKARQLPKAIIVVNIYGQSADMDRLCALGERYGVPVVEDAAESLGATYKNKFSGSIGKLGIYSFNGNKVITTSGGGMLVSDDQQLIERAKFLSTQAREAGEFYLHKDVGFNYRMSNVLAGIGRGQLKVLDERVKARQNVFKIYGSSLKHLKEIVWMPEADFGVSARWLSTFTLDPDNTCIKPQELIKRLNQAHIEARHVWNPLHRQPLFDGCEYFEHEPGFSVSDQLFACGICLPSGSNLTRTQQTRIISVLENSLVNGQTS